MATPIKSEELPVRSEGDIVLARQRVRTWATELKFTLVDQTKVVTAASEIARNTVKYGGGGTLRLEQLADGIRRGLRMVFADRGPGIANLEQAMRDGFTSGSGMGMGLGGAKRLVSEFHIESKLGEGTRVVLTRWK